MRGSSGNSHDDINSIFHISNVALAAALKDKPIQLNVIFYSIFSITVPN